jgi:hypothetical protein
VGVHLFPWATATFGNRATLGVLPETNSSTSAGHGPRRTTTLSAQQQVRHESYPGGTFGNAA